MAGDSGMNPITAKNAERITGALKNPMLSGIFRFTKFAAANSPITENATRQATLRAFILEGADSTTRQTAGGIPRPSPKKDKQRCRRMPHSVGDIDAAYPHKPTSTKDKTIEGRRPKVDKNVERPAPRKKEVFKIHKNMYLLEMAVEERNKFREAPWKMKSVPQISMEITWKRPNPIRSILSWTAE